MHISKLDPNAGYYTLINTFIVEPDKAEELISVLSHATAHAMNAQPGFISANLHISADKKRVANYGQWRSKADVDAMMANPEARTHMLQAASIATSFDPIYYELRETHGPLRHTEE